MDFAARNRCPVYSRMSVRFGQEYRSKGLYVINIYFDDQENEIRIDNNLRLILITPLNIDMFIKPPKQLSNIYQYQSITTHILSANQLKSIIVYIDLIFDELFQ